MKKVALLPLFLAFSLAAQKPISLNQCFETFEFYPTGAPDFDFLKDGKTYLQRDEKGLHRFDLATEAMLETVLSAKEIIDAGLIFSDYSISPDGSKMLVADDAQPLYRHSFAADWKILDLKTKVSQPLFEAKSFYATWSPDGQKVAFVHENDLFFKDLTSNQVVRVTDDGKKNEIINGMPDWVYEEEFSSVTGAGMSAIDWSADSKKLAFIRFDERKVPEMTLTHYEGKMYPRLETFKYPKVGEPNSLVQVKIFDLETRKTVAAETGGAEADHYLPRIKWSLDPEKLTITRLNRPQNQLDLLLFDAKTGQTQTILSETSTTWVEIHDNLTFLPDGNTFLWTSEKDGWQHFFLHDFPSGRELRQLTKGAFEVTAFYGFDEKTGEIFYQTAQPTPMDRQIFSQKIDGGQPVCLTPEKGTNEAEFSGDFSFFVKNWSDANTPNRVTLCDRTGRETRQLVDNQEVMSKRKEYAFSRREFFEAKTESGETLNGWILKPSNFDLNRKYPVLMSVYGGPGSQEVKNEYDGYWGTYYQMLNQLGYVVACVDNRGTGGRGKAFKSCTHLQLGKLETIDQIEAAKFLGRQSWADPKRIGIWGWSYGGYMASSCAFKGSDFFKAAVAVAPVTNWKWYDSAYTERYMRDTKSNEKGYAENSPVNFASGLKGAFFLAHGMTDDNVHWQNSAELTNELIKANKPFDTFYYPNRNHGIYGDGATMHLMARMTEFLLEKL